MEDNDVAQRACIATVAENLDVLRNVTRNGGGDLQVRNRVHQAGGGAQHH